MGGRFPEDPALPEVLAAYGVDPGDWLGDGAEARVYALDRERVLRVHRPGPTREAIERRAQLLAELERPASKLEFGIPRVLERACRCERWITIEPRWPGKTLSSALSQAEGASRAALLHSYLEAGRRLAELACPRPFYGDLLVDDAIRTDSFRGYLAARARRSLDAAGPPLSAIDARELAAALPEPERGTFVYLDAHPDNVLVDGERVSAIIDFGSVAIVGESRFGAVVPATYLLDRDGPLVEAWLQSHELFELYAPVRRWLAAFWSFASDDGPLFDWCRRVLLERAPSS